MIWKCMNAHSLGDLHFYEGTIDTEASICILERDVQPSRHRLFLGSQRTFHYI